MFSRKVLFPVVLATAAGAPYLLTEGKLSQKAQSTFQSALSLITTTGDASPQFPSEFTYGPRAENPRLALDAAYIGPASVDFSEAFRVDISPQSVTQRWPRVTTVTAETGLEGLRVPLLTGTRMDDLAGTLTYYFNSSHQVQRLAFDGFTGDDRRLLALLTQYYGLQPEPTLDAGMYVTRWNGAPTSVLRISRAPVITTATSHAQLHIQLELNRPSVSYGLSPEFLALLDRDRNSRRW